MKKLGITILFLVGIVGAHANCTSGIVAAPIVDSITVDIAGNVTICWQPVVDPDIVSYTIFMVNPLTSANDSIDLVVVPTNCYTIPAGSNNSDIQSVEYGVVARDICNNLSPVGVNYHNTIFLEDTVDICASSITLRWNPYDDFNSGLNVLYNIYVSVNSGSYMLAGTSLTTDYTYLGINQGSTYDFYVMGIENGGAGPFSSSSNDIRPLTINALKIPAYNYLYSATVIDSAQISVQFYVDTVADISSYNILRATSLGGPYNSVGSVTKFIGMNPLVQFTDDNNVKANETYYFYRIETINTCIVPTGNLSNIGRTIWLDVVSDPMNATNTLTFTQYEGWLGNVQRYDVYRAVGGIWESSPVTSFSPFSGTKVYVDDITSVFEGDGEYCYKIVGIENTVAHVGGLPEATSTSNEACALHKPLLYIPNAFIPESDYNPVFKPVLTFAYPDTYRLVIFNKLGLDVFESRDVSVGWNGRVNNSGNMSKADTYVYVLEFHSVDGIHFIKRGLVTLIR